VVVAAGGTDRGRARENNEDDFLCEASRGLFIVADGMGGEVAGGEASRITVDVLGQQLTPERIQDALGPPDGVKQLLQEAVQTANDALVSAGRQRREWAGMGSTVVVGVYAAGVSHLSHLGDSRAYLVRQGRASALTRDHSMAALLVAQGQLRPAEARSHPLRNQLTAALGQEEDLKPDYTATRLQVGDRLVLCSDGLWDLVEEADLARIALAHDDPARIVPELIAAANQAGGLDNITAVVLVIRDPHEAEAVAEFARIRGVEAATQPAARYAEPARV
jgi:protein phosphatase